jgi:hypothetical protein
MDTKSSSSYTTRSSWKVAQMSSACTYVKSRKGPKAKGWTGQEVRDESMLGARRLTNSRRHSFYRVVSRANRTDTSRRNSARQSWRAVFTTISWLWSEADNSTDLTACLPRAMSATIRYMIQDLHAAAPCHRQSASNDLFPA